MRGDADRAAVARQTFTLLCRDRRRALGGLLLIRRGLHAGIVGAGGASGAGGAGGGGGGKVLETTFDVEARARGAGLPASVIVSLLSDEHHGIDEEREIDLP